LKKIDTSPCVKKCSILVNQNCGTAQGRIKTYSEQASIGAGNVHEVVEFDVALLDALNEPLYFFLIEI